MTARTLAVAAGLALGLAAPRLAAEEPRQTLIVPLAGRLARPLARAPARLTAELRRAAQDAGRRPVVARVPAAEVAAITGCAGESTDCFDAIATTLDVDEVVIGELAARDDGTVEVSLTRIAPGRPPIERRAVLRGKGVDALAAELAPVAADLFRDEAAPNLAVPGPGPAGTGRAGPAPDRGGFDSRRVDTSTWALAGGGAALAGAGAVLLVMAGQRQGEVDRAPGDTGIDLERLADLEASGRRLTRFGNAALVVGGAAAVVGTVLLVRQGRSRPGRRPTTVGLAPMPVPGGAGLTLTVWSSP